MAGFPSLKQQLRGMKKDADPVLAKQVESTVAKLDLAEQARKAIAKGPEAELACLQRLEGRLRTALQRTSAADPTRKQLTDALRDLQKAKLIAKQPEREFCEA